jgi:hypothetical protein
MLLTPPRGVLGGKKRTSTKKTSLTTPQNTPNTPPEMVGGMGRVTKIKWHVQELMLI